MSDEAERAAEIVPDDPSELRRVRELFSSLFASHTLSDCVELSIEGTQQLEISRSGFTYGETGLQALLYMLSVADLPQYCCRCVPQRCAPEVRCEVCGKRPAGPAVADLGSGIGNLVVGAALLAAAELVHVSSVSGVELLPTLHGVAQTVLADLSAHADIATLPAPLPPCRVECADLIDFDVSEIDVCYLCSSVFPNETLQRWSAHAAATMRLGSKVITPAFPLAHRSFRVERSMTCTFSWGVEKVFVHVLVSHAPAGTVQVAQKAASRAGLLLAWDASGHSGWTFTDAPGAASDDEWRAAGERLHTDGFALIDGFAGEAAAAELGAQLASLYYCAGVGEFRHGKVGGGPDGAAADARDDVDVRGDVSALIEASDPRAPALSTLFFHCDQMVGRMAHSSALPEMQAVGRRSRPMLACYGRGGRYVRHVDNPDGNGRLLTCIYYLNGKWKDGDGGELILYPQRRQGSAEGADGAEGAGERRVVIEPLLDRLVLFWSDGRTPHEVRPSNVDERLAISSWYHSSVAVPPSDESAAPLGALSVGASPHPPTPPTADPVATGRAMQELFFSGYTSVHAMPSSAASPMHLLCPSGEEESLSWGSDEGDACRALLADAVAFFERGAACEPRAAGLAVRFSKLLIAHSATTAGKGAAGADGAEVAGSTEEAVRSPLWLPKLEGASACCVWRLDRGVGSAHVTCRVRPTAAGGVAGWPRSTKPPVEIPHGEMLVLHCENQQVLATLLRLEGGAAVGVLWAYRDGTSPAQIHAAQDLAYLARMSG